MDKNILEAAVKKEIMKRVAQAPDIQQRLQDPSAVIQIGSGQPVFRNNLSGEQLAAAYSRTVDLDKFLNDVTEVSKKAKESGLNPEQINQRVAEYLKSEYSGLMNILNPEFFK